MPTLSRWTGSAWEEVMAPPSTHTHSGAYAALPGGYVAGSYYGPHGAAVSVRTFAANELRLMPYEVRSSETFDRIAIETTTAGGAGTLYRLGIFNHNPATGRPGTVVLDAGTVPGDAAPGAQELTISQLLEPGWYWLGAACQVHSGSPAIRAVSGGNPIVYSLTAGAAMAIQNSYAVTGVSGAFASLVGASVSTSTVGPIVLLRA